MENQERFISIIQPGQALMSLRDSGYSFPSAIAEVVDNSLEANANHIAIELFESTNNSGKKHIDRVAIADDGTGMNIDILHHYLVIGHSTRWMQKNTIGKYGVGAKLAALNFGLCIEAWSRTDESQPWQYVKFDLEHALKQEQTGQHQQVGVNAPADSEIPDDYQSLLPGKKGTLVVWSKIDRLENGRAATNTDELKIGLTKELGRIFREFINNGIELTLNGNTIIHHDPLMLMENSWADNVLTKELKKTDLDNAPKRGNKHFPATILANNIPILTVEGKTATMTVTIYPREILRQRGMGGDTLAKKLRVPDNEGRISFMRLGREISYTSVPRIFGRAVDKPDRFIGIEINFTPDFDEYFGVRNVKRGVEPFDSLRTNIRKELDTYLKTARQLIDEAWGQAAQKEKSHSGEHGRIESEVSAANKTMPKNRAKPKSSPEDEQKAQENELETLAEDTGHDTSPDEKEAYKEAKKDLPFVIENVSFPGKEFVDIKHVNNQVIIRINTRHRFYKEMWKPLTEISKQDAGAVNGSDAVKTARRAVEGLTLMIIAFGKAQTMDEDPHKYEDLTTYWGQFIDTMMGKVKDVT
ncbi:ATP-binding protein [Photobacterium leiognathi]|uniref:ATP-binding protein n=1 Tax=Photobacterium leiognathi TaxID=553611 RepID=UPI002981A974|nr:ATP-binding protein [Photobacterium leiognathi]